MSGEDIEFRRIKTEAEVGVLLPQVRGCLELLETGRKGGRIFP